MSTKTTRPLPAIKRPLKAKTSTEVPPSPDGRPWIEHAKALGVKHTISEPEAGKVGITIEALYWHPKLLPAQAGTPRPGAREITHRWSYKIAATKDGITKTLANSSREFRAMKMVNLILGTAIPAYK